MADFAAAQKRILERRRARAEALHAVETSHREARTAQLTALPPSLRTYAFDILSFWDNIKSPHGTRPAFRVGQVDAELLDEALLDLLKKQAGEGLKYYGAHLKDDWSAEITTAIRAFMWKLSIWDHGQSYGASLQGLKYIDARGNPDAQVDRKEATKWQRGLYGLITVGGRYTWSRWEERLSSLENGYDEPSPLIQRLSRITTFLSTSHNIAAFLSFLIFLYNGRYRTLTDRILRLRLVPTSNQTNREVSFEFLNRQLVWHAFTEFLLFILPLVGISRWKRWIARAWKKTRAGFASLTKGASTHEEEDEEDIAKGELAFLPERTCAICYQDQNPAGGQSEQDVLASSGANSGVIGSAMTDITNPYEADPCGCIYCFVCLAERIEAEEGEGLVCLRCGEWVKQCRPWNGDVLPGKRAERTNPGSEEKTSYTRKSVMFDLDDEKEEQMRDDEDPLEAMEPMPMDESQAWSEVNEGNNPGEEESEDGD
jgi:peroxin-2